MHFILEWFDTVDICRFDSSLCRKYRSQWLKLLQSPLVVLSNAPLWNDHLVKHDLLLRWLVTRKLRVREVVIPEFFSRSEPFYLTELLVRSGDRLQSVELVGQAGCLEFIHVTDNPSRTTEKISLWCPKLKTLTYTRIRHFRDSTFTALESCIYSASLQSLNMSHIFTEAPEAFGAIGQLVALTTLNVSHTHITDAVITQVLSKCKLVTELNLGSCTHITDITLNFIARNRPNMKNLNVSYIASTVVGISAVSEHCTQMTHFQMYGDITMESCNNISKNWLKLSHFSAAYLFGTQLPTICSGCKKLTYLDLSGGYAVDDTTLADIAQHCAGLTHLNVSHCGKISENGLFVIATKCHKLKAFHCERTTCARQCLSKQLITALCQNSGATLEELNFKYCAQFLYDVNLECIAAHCPNLSLLNISGGGKVTDVGVVAIVTRCPKLRELCVLSHSGVTQLTAKAIATHSRWIDKKAWYMKHQLYPHFP